MSLESDLAFYNQIKPDLMAQDLLGQYVLIFNGELIDVYPTYQAAYNAAVAQFGTAQVFIKKIEEQDTLETI